MGISADFLGPGVGPGRVSKRLWDAIIKQWPRDGMQEGVKTTLCELCRRKPAMTYDNFVGEFGEKYLKEEGYSSEQKKIIDFLESAP
jgi:hypothetical protein